MRFPPELLQLTSLLFLLCFSISNPATARPLATRDANVRTPQGLDLGGGWIFIFTKQPALLYPVENAAEGMNFLYEHVKNTAYATARNPADSMRQSTGIIFRVGNVALTFTDRFDASYGDTFKALIFWPAIATFCEKMQSFVNRGEVLYFEGVIRGTGGDIVVSLTLLQSDGAI